MTHNKQT